MSGILEQLFERRASILPLNNVQPWIDAGIISPTPSGISVTPHKALHHSAVYACVRILAETVASLPLIMYERLDRGKRRASDHYLYELLKDRPNDVMTSFEYREALQGHLTLWGNAYSEIVYDPSGRVIELWPLRPDCMLNIVPVDGQYAYQYQLPSGETRWLNATRVWHLRGLGSDGRIGYSPIRLMRYAIGLGMAAEEYGARFFSGDATASVVLQHPSPLTPDAYERIKASWQDQHSGLEKKHRVSILEEGMTLEKISIPPDDAQFLETRRFQLQEIARMYRIPPHMLADLERATFSNIEHQSLEFVMHTMRPWLVRWEQSIKHSLMLEKDRARFFPEFLVDGLLRGDIVARYGAYAQGRQNGWLSANDIRELENMNPVEGGDIYFVPLNMVPASVAAEGLSAPGASAGVRGLLPTPGRRLGEERAIRSATYRRRLGHAHAPVFAQTAGRVIRAEVRNLREALAKTLRQRGLSEFNLWLDTFYSERGASTLPEEAFSKFIRTQMLPVYQTYADVVATAAAEEVDSEVGAAELEVFMRKYVDTYVKRHVSTSQGQIRALIDDPDLVGEDLLAALEKRFDEWVETRPDKIASRETVGAGGAVAKFVYAAAGFTALRWISSGKSCPFCSGLDGQVVGMESNFIDEGQQYQPDGADGPLVPNTDIGHPPAHDGCDCQIGPA